MPERAAGIRLLTKLPVLFWAVALACAAADLLTKQTVFDYFPRRFPEIKQQAERLRQVEFEQLADQAAAARRKDLAELARAGRIAEFIDRAESTGRRDLATVARQIEQADTNYPAIAVVPGFIQIVRSGNRGGVFGLGQGSGWWLVFGLLAGAFVIWFAHRADARHALLQIALGLVLAGAIGNLYDRFVFGYVRDFIDVCYWPGRHWPAFNVADSGICVGAVYLAVHAFFFTPATAKKPGK